MIAKTRRHAFKTILKAVGYILILLAVGIVIYNVISEVQAAEVSADIVEQLPPVMTENVTAPASIETAAENNASFTAVTGKEATTENIDPDRAMPSVDVEGESCIGILSIPDLDLLLPVMEEWSYPLLKKAPCRYSGSVYQNNMSICAHNYARHFGNLNKLPIGAKVVFTDTEGNKFSYEIESFEHIDPYDYDTVEKNADSLLLFTCTPGGAMRVVVKCRKIDDWR